MAIRFRCCQCNQLLSIGTRKVGTSTTCPNCSATQMVPSSPAALGPAASGLAFAANGVSPRGSFPLIGIAVALVVVLGGLVAIRLNQVQAQSMGPIAEPAPSAIVAAAPVQTPTPPVQEPVLAPLPAPAEAKPAVSHFTLVGEAKATAEPSAAPAPQLVKNDPPADNGEPKNVEPAKCELGVCNKPAVAPLPDRETFGTAVSFARNPQEASQIARAERKLAFILHVSGNFEDTAFT